MPRKSDASDALSSVIDKLINLGFKYMYKPAKAIKDETLGVLKLESVVSGNLAEYISNVDFDGLSVELILYTDEESGELNAAIESAKKMVKQSGKVKRSVDAFIAKKVLDGVNKFIRPDDPLSASDLNKNLVLKTIEIDAEGEAAFWYEAGDVLLGHGLLLRGTCDGKIKDFDTPG